MHYRDSDQGPLTYEKVEEKKRERRNALPGDSNTRNV